MRNKKLVVLLSVLGVLALIIIIASVVFSVRTVAAVCKNSYNETELDAEVIAAANIPFTSIFMLDENEIIDRINSNVVRAEMETVERIFPNKVNLIYRKLSDDIFFEAGGKFFTASSSGKVLSDKKPLDTAGIAEVVFGQAVGLPQVGSYVGDSDSANMRTLSTLFNSLSLFDYHGSQPVSKGVYARIDLSGPDVIITTTTGVKFELRCSTAAMTRAESDVIFKQLKTAIEMYISGKYSKTGGKYIITYNFNASYSSQA